jgi:hypothetical protein
MRSSRIKICGPERVNISNAVIATADDIVRLSSGRWPMPSSPWLPNWTPVALSLSIFRLSKCRYLLAMMASSRSSGHRGNWDLGDQSL